MLGRSLTSHFIIEEEEEEVVCNQSLTVNFIHTQYEGEEKGNPLDLIRYCSHLGVKTPSGLRSNHIHNRAWCWATGLQARPQGVLM